MDVCLARASAAHSASFPSSHPTGSTSHPSHHSPRILCLRVAVLPGPITCFLTVLGLQSVVTHAKAFGLQAIDIVNINYKDDVRMGSLYVVTPLRA